MLQRVLSLTWFDLNISGKDETRRLAGDGSYGGAYQVDDSIMQEMFDLCLSEVLALLRVK